MNGLEAARAIRRVSAAVPLMIYSSFVNEFAREEARSIGISELVSKSEQATVLVRKAGRLLYPIAARVEYYPRSTNSNTEDGSKPRLAPLNIFSLHYCADSVGFHCCLLLLRAIQCGCRLLVAHWNRNKQIAPFREDSFRSRQHFGIGLVTTLRS